MTKDNDISCILYEGKISLYSKNRGDFLYERIITFESEIKKGDYVRYHNNSNVVEKCDKSNAIGKVVSSPVFTMEPDINVMPTGKNVQRIAVVRLMKD